MFHTLNGMIEIHLQHKNDVLQWECIYVLDVTFVYVNDMAVMMLFMIQKKHTIGCWMFDVLATYLYSIIDLKMKVSEIHLTSHHHIVLNINSEKIGISFISPKNLMAYASYIIIYKDKIDKLKVSWSYRKKSIWNIRLIFFDWVRRVVKDWAIYYDIIYSEDQVLYSTQTNEHQTIHRQTI